MRVCSYLYCYNPVNPVPNGPCLTGGTGYASTFYFVQLLHDFKLFYFIVLGLGALGNYSVVFLNLFFIIASSFKDGTPCYTANGLSNDVN